MRRLMDPFTLATIASFILSVAASGHICEPSCPSTHCCISKTCQPRLKLDDACSPVDIQNHVKCPCCIGFVCRVADVGYKCQDHRLFEANEPVTCPPSCDMEHCCVHGYCQKRLKTGDFCYPAAIQSHEACPCCIGNVCVLGANGHHSCRPRDETTAAPTTTTAAPATTTAAPTTTTAAPATTTTAPATTTAAPTTTTAAPTTTTRAPTTTTRAPTTTTAAPTTTRAARTTTTAAPTTTDSTPTTTEDPSTTTSEPDSSDPDSSTSSPRRRGRKRQRPHRSQS